MRVAYVRHELLTMDPATAADVLTVVAAGAEAKRPAFEELMLATAMALASPGTEGARRAMLASAAARGRKEVARLLEPREPTEVELLPVPDFGGPRPLTLGERKSVARTHDRALIARVLRDPHPDVIKIVLGNPTLTEDDVVRLASRRPIATATLREVFRATRWAVRYRVRRTLIQNPCCPLDVAMQLAPLLSAADARKVAASTELADELRLACRRVATDTVH